MVRQVVAEFDAVTGPFNRRLDQLDRSINRFERRAVTGLGRVETSVNSLVAASAKFSAVSGVFAGAFGTREALRFTDAAKRIRNALREAGDASEETFDKVYKSSVRALAGFEDTSQGVLRFTKALNGNQELDRTIRQLETLNKLLALSGKTAQERSSTMIQFSQALQAGFLGGEELRAIRENAPIDLVRAIAREAGGTISDLKDLAKNYKLTTEVMVRALDSLEEEADRRFQRIAVTTADAANVFRSGTIRFVEGLDAGLGATEAIIISLKELGKILGENAGLAEGIGAVAQGALVASAVTYGGRRANGATEGFRNAAAARREELAVAKQQLATDKQAVIVSSKQLDQANKKERLAHEQSRSAKTRNAATRRQIRAAGDLAKAQKAVAASTVAVATAQGRMLITTRALTFAAATLKGVWAFVGGLPGVIFTAATALAYFALTAEDSADRMERLSEMNSNIASDTAALRDIVQNTNDLISTSADVADTAAGRIVAANKVQYESRKKLLEAEVAFEKIQQEKRRRALADAADERNAILQRTRNAVGPLAGPAVRPQAQREAAAAKGAEELAAFELRIAKLQATVIDTEQAIVSAQQTIASGFNPEGVDGLVSELTEAQKEADKLIEKMRTGEEKLSQELDRLGKIRAELVDLFGEGSKQVDAFDQAVDRYVDSMIEAENNTNSASSAVSGMVNQVIRLRNVMASFGSVNFTLDTQLAGINSEIAALEAGMSQTRATAEGTATAIGKEMAAEMAAAGATVDEIAAAIDARQSRVREIANRTEVRDGILSDRRDAKSGGGGAAKSRTAKDLLRIQKEAQSFIEAQATAQERFSDRLKAAIELRRQLVATYGEENDLVQKLDTAIERYENGASNWLDTVNEGLAQAIINGDGLLDIVGRIIAKMVEANGVQAFQSLFSGEGISEFFKILVSPSAMGNVLQNGSYQNLQKFANGGIVNSPTFFPMKSGLGVAGEAGAEAIVPLPDGRSIPVMLRGGGGGVQVHIHENASDGAHQVIQSNGGQRIDVLLRKQVTGMVDGGQLDGPMKRRYGISKKPMGG